MSLQWIRKKYGVPSRRGGRVRYTYKKPARMGTIRSARGSYLRILLDGDARPGLYHPVWELEYLDVLKEMK